MVGGYKTPNFISYKLLTTSFIQNLFLNQTSLILQTSSGTACLFGASLLLETRFYSATSKKSCSTTEYRDLQLDPWWVTGFVDGEGCFKIQIVKDNRQKTGWQVRLYFSISLHIKDKPLLEQIKILFRHVGSITKYGPQSLHLQVQSIKELKIIIDHFEKFPLLTNKRADFELFKRVLILIKNKEHLTPEGLRKIIAIRAAMNLGLSDEVKKAFPDVFPVTRPLVLNQKIQDPYWLSGFTSAEGCFFIQIYKAKTKQGKAVNLVYQLTQHTREEQLMRSILKYLDCGGISKNRTWLDIKVTKYRDISEKIIPFFKKHQIIGVKARDFEDWCKAAELMKQKKHLTLEGLEEIRKIKAGMNRGRKLD